MKENNPAFIAVYNITFVVIIIMNFIITTSSHSQPLQTFDSKTNTIRQGSTHTQQFFNSAMTSSLFNWQMVETPTIQLIKDIQFIDSLYGYASYYEGLMRTTDGGFGWQVIYYSQGSEMNAIDFLNQDTGWYVGGGRIRKTINGGANWIIQDYPPFGSVPNYYSVKFFDYNTGVVTGLRDYLGYIIKTTNSGQNWAPIYLAGQSGTDIYGQFWFNQDSGWIYGRDIFLKTTNGGNDFISYLYSLPPTINGHYGLLGISFINANTGWLSGSSIDQKNMYKTINGGLNWVFQDNPVAQYQFAQLDDVLFIDENRGWAGGYSGQIITTTNGGSNWLIDVSASTWFACFANYGSKKLWCGAKYGQVWYLDDIPPVHISQNNTSIPKAFELKQNFPNPFNNETIIEYELSTRAYVTINVYNLTGKLIDNLINQRQEAGRYNLRYYAYKLASGVYFYRMETEKYSESKKFVLIK
ncbi:MAG: T9SS type A sorting domain-containing protein [Ignavibacteria bacterium]|nr:T9SS type A sorting domain-containing protein [Ignavibacteria bacterium]